MFFFIYFKALNFSFFSALYQFSFIIISSFVAVFHTLTALVEKSFTEVKYVFHKRRKKCGKREWNIYFSTRKRKKESENSKNGKTFPQFFPQVEKRFSQGVILWKTCGKACKKRKKERKFPYFFHRRV